MIAAERQVHDALIASATVTALVDAKIYPDIAPPKTALPAIVYERRSTDPQTSIHDGIPFANKVIVGVNAWAYSRLDAESLGDAVIFAMGTVGVPIGRFGQLDDATQCYASVIDFEVWET